MCLTLKPFNTYQRVMANVGTWSRANLHSVDGLALNFGINIHTNVKDDRK